MQTIDHSKRPKRHKNWTIVIAPIFVFTALFFLYLITNDPFVSPLNQASDPVTESYENEHSAEVIRRGKHVAIISLLLILNGVLATIVFFTMKRWKNRKYATFVKQFIDGAICLSFSHRLSSMQSGA